MLLLYVALGGAFGSMCRYVLVTWLNLALGRTFPYATMVVNVLGSFLMGVALAFIVTLLPRGKELYLLLAVGAMGGFTTFSSFSFDTYMLIERGFYVQAAVYTIGSVVFSVAAFFGGMALYKVLTA